MQHHEINSKTQNWESAIMAGSGRNFTSAAAYKSRRTRRQLVWQHRDSIHCKHGNPSEHQLFRHSRKREIMAKTRCMYFDYFLDFEFESKFRLWSIRLQNWICDTSQSIMTSCWMCFKLHWANLNIDQMQRENSISYQLSAAKISNIKT